MLFTRAIALVTLLAGPALAQPYDLTWHTIAGGGGTSSSGVIRLSGTIGQPVGGPALTGGDFQVISGFWAGVAPAGTGVPAATVNAAVSRKANAAGPSGVCDLGLMPGVRSEARQGGITQMRLTFDVAPGGPGASPVTIQQATCAAPTYAAYTGGSTVSASVAGNDLVLIFTPGLENARSYKVTLGPNVSSIAGQFVEIRGLVGDVNSDGQVNATDRSVVVGAWTGAGFTCPTDSNSDGLTNATDRSIVVGAWTGGQNCTP